MFLFENFFGYCGQISKESKKNLTFETKKQLENFEYKVKNLEQADLFSLLSKTHTSQYVSPLIFSVLFDHLNDKNKLIFCNCKVFLFHIYFLFITKIILKRRLPKALQLCGGY